MQRIRSLFSYEHTRLPQTPIPSNVIFSLLIFETLCMCNYLQNIWMTNALLFFYGNLFLSVFLAVLFFFLHPYLALCSFPPFVVWHAELYIAVCNRKTIADDNVLFVSFMLLPTINTLQLFSSLFTEPREQSFQFLCPEKLYFLPLQTVPFLLFSYNRRRRIPLIPLWRTIDSDWCSRIIWSFFLLLFRKREKAKIQFRQRKKGNKPQNLCYKFYGSRNGSND